MSLTWILAPVLAATTFGALDESGRVRTILDSGAIALVEPDDRSPTVAVQLFAASKACPETVEGHGRRHLLEHLLAKGRGGDLGARLEAESWVLTAETFRDFMVLRMEGPPQGMETAFQALSEWLSPPRWTADQIAAESAILEQELGLLSLESRLSIESWKIAYQDQGLDPIGRLEAIRSTTPEDLATLHGRQFASDCLTLSIVGKVDPKAVTAQLKSQLAKAPPPLKASWAKRPKGMYGISETEDGKAIVLPVPSFANPATVWCLAAAFDRASESPDRFVVYTPSLQNGLVILGSRNLRDPMFTSSTAPSQGSFAIGKTLVRGWYMQYMQSVSGRAFLNGAFQVQALGGRPETMLENIDAMRSEDFVLGVRALDTGQLP